MRCCQEGERGAKWRVSNYTPSLGWPSSRGKGWPAVCKSGPRLWKSTVQDYKKNGIFCRMSRPDIFSNIAMRFNGVFYNSSSKMNYTILYISTTYQRSLRCHGLHGRPIYEWELIKVHISGVQWLIWFYDSGPKTSKTQLAAAFTCISVE